MGQVRTVTFTGRSSAKGRNGYFVLTEADVWLHDGRVRVELYSRTRGGAPPALFELEPAELNRLIGAMRTVADEKE
jgi:hypothetical protein